MGEQSALIHLTLTQVPYSNEKQRNTHHHPEWSAVLHSKLASLICIEGLMQLCYDIIQIRIAVFAYNFWLRQIQLYCESNIPDRPVGAV